MRARRRTGPGWDSSEDAQAFLAGLFQACLSVNSLHDNLRVYISLRQELYDDVPALYEEAQKGISPLSTFSSGRACSA